MGKRFTTGEKWSDPWFRKLKPALKLLFVYLCDSCDAAGVWSVDREMAEFAIGTAIPWDDVMTAMDGRVVRLNGSDRKWHLTGFVVFQQSGELDPKNNAHKAILRLYDHHGLPHSTNAKSTPLLAPSKGLFSPPVKVESGNGKVEGSAEGRSMDGDGLADSLAQPTPAAPKAARPPEDQWAYEKRESWAIALAPPLGRKLGPSTWTGYKRLVDLHGVETVKKAADSLDRDERWDDKIEKVIEAWKREAPQPVTSKEPTPLEICDHIVATIGWMAAAKYLRLCDKITTKRALSDLLFDAPECQQELIAGYRMVTQP